MKYTEGQKIRMKEDCSFVKKGEICTLHWGNKDGDLKDRLFAWGKDSYCSCQNKWELYEEKKTLKYDAVKGTLLKIRGVWYVRVLKYDWNDGDPLYTLSYASEDKKSDVLKMVNRTFGLFYLKEHGYKIIVPKKKCDKCGK